MSVVFDNYSIQVKEAMQDAAVNWLIEACGEVEEQTKRNCAVVTGKTKGSFSHVVDGDQLAGHIGSNYENAIWEEFGTGEYAVEGDGRKLPWVYCDYEGKYHTTKGKKPKRMLHNAYHSLKPALIDEAKERFGELGS